MMGGFDLMAAMLDNQPKVQTAFKSGIGVAWGDQASCMFCAVARFFRPGYHNNPVSAWLPALEGRTEHSCKMVHCGGDIARRQRTAFIAGLSPAEREKLRGYETVKGRLARISGPIALADPHSAKKITLRS